MVKGQTVEIRVTFPGLQTQSANLVLSNTPPARDFALAFGFSEEITVGSRLAGAAAEKAVPVDILTPQQIATTGASETNQIIQALAPSFNFPRPTITDGTDSVRPATLRGLGPDQVLVLINGKRRHNGALVHVNGSIGRGSTGVDLNAIPASAIQRIEILRDGAAAQYGSDAIAGVINIVLKSGVNPTTLTAKAGMTTHEDGGLFDVQCEPRVADRPRRRSSPPSSSGTAARPTAPGRTRATRSSPAMPGTTASRSRTSTGATPTRPT